MFSSSSKNNFRLNILNTVFCIVTEKPNQGSVQADNYKAIVLYYIYARAHAHGPTTEI